jgi:hypothetical protein
MEAATTADYRNAIQATRAEVADVLAFALLEMILSNDEIDGASRADARTREDPIPPRLERARSNSRRAASKGECP